MLELTDPDKKLSKQEYDELFPDLKIELGTCQRALREAGIPVVLVVEGWDAAGKGRLINRLSQVLDPRGFSVHSMATSSDEERLRPWMWRYWQKLPAAGRMALFSQSWYHRALAERMEGEMKRRSWEEACDDITEFERQLADDGAVVIKFWLHISQKEQRRRLKELDANPATSWRVRPEELQRNRHYDKWQETIDEMLTRTAAAHAPWHVIESTQGRFRRTKVFQIVVEAIKAELARRRAHPKLQGHPMAEPEASPLGEHDALDRVDLDLSLSREDYNEQLKPLQVRLFELQNELYRKRVPAVIVYQGWDAAGKGGNIRRLTAGLDPRGYEVIPVAAPTTEEKARHYLWRFWRELPKGGHLAIFDRSWYGRVLVERVEGFCSEDEWRRAYAEINQFEHQLIEFGTALVKFWLHIDPDEQLRRFQAREQTSYKKWKITEEDWRNRDKWARYKVAVVDMLRQTSPPYAPWTILEANCKLYARIKALKTVVAAWEQALER